MFHVKQVMFAFHVKHFHFNFFTEMGCLFILDALL